jgi:hypothetical protein
MDGRKCLVSMNGFTVVWSQKTHSLSARAADASRGKLAAGYYGTNSNSEIDSPERQIRLSRERPLK